MSQIRFHTDEAELLTGPLTGPLTGVYGRNGMGSMLFAVLAVAAQLDREYIREKTLEGQRTAAGKETTAGGPRSSIPTCSSSPWR